MTHTNMDQVTIVEYEPKYAASLADMWNRSRDSWGGDNAIRSEEAILSEHNNSTHIKVFLAVVNDEVVGYCSFSHYKDDEGALYIPLLNVRPDYHGRKVGKTLVLRALQETINLGWSRLDLHTWPGNTKAVPTYKKSGFFWEKRDDMTHLMNFIPSVLQTEPVRAYFNDIDWYTASTRVLLVEPDGRKENGFDYFTYEWNKDGRYLKMEYERTGRGLRLIETDEYLISATVVNHSLPFGKEYEIVYELVSKNNTPLTVEVHGVSNKQIEFDLSESRVVTGTDVIKGKFRVHPIEEEQNPWQNHPVVEAELSINGLKTMFKVGIAPTYPASITLESTNHTFNIGQEMELFLTVENGFNEETVFAFDLPTTSTISFVQRHIEITIPAKGRVSIPVTAQLHEYGVLQQSIELLATIDNKQIVVHRELSALFQGHTAMFGGQIKHEWIISYGVYSVHLNTLNNRTTVNQSGQEIDTVLIFPKLGLPFSSEFKRNRPIHVAQYAEQQVMVMEAHYTMPGYEGILLVAITKLHGNGIVQHHYRIQNTLDVSMTHDLVLQEGIIHDITNNVIPYDGDYFDLRQGVDASNKDYWDYKLVMENWLFAYRGLTTHGISWPASQQLMKDGWFFCIDHSLGTLLAGQSIETEPVCITVGTFTDWRDFRAFVMQEENTKQLQTSEHLTYALNDGNPFVKDSFQVTLKERTTIYLDGQVTVSSELDSLVSDSLTVDSDQQRSEVTLPLHIKGDHKVDVVDIQLNFEPFETKKRKVIFPITHTEVQCEASTEQGLEVFTADNGTLRIQASPAFAPSLFSITHQGREWLDSSFPQVGPKSWWNPWLGGIATNFRWSSLLSLMEEPRTTSFTQLTDNKGNEWSGIRMSVTITNNEKYNGLILHHHYLLLPGAPVVCHVIMIEQLTGAHLPPIRMITSSFFKASNDLKNSRIQLNDIQGNPLVYKAGRIQYDIETQGIVNFGSSEHTERLTLATHPNLELCHAFVNTHAMSSTVIEELLVKNGESKFATPQFYTLSDQMIPDHAYTDLFNIRFTTQSS
ncbi:GNAT family N-acetyltransferase [Paenibacillus antarcticus]|nr:GNAT family N-acetyltransferase [Paenibacillus antarcticus]